MIDIYPNSNDLNNIKIEQIYFDTKYREYKVAGKRLLYPAFIKNSQVKFNFQTQNKPYAVVQDLPQYVSSINRSYDLSFEVHAKSTQEALSNYIALHELLKLMKTNFEKTRQLTVAGQGTADSNGIINNYAINNMAINSRANFRITLEVNPFIYNSAEAIASSTKYSNSYDILLTAFDYKIDDSSGVFKSLYSVDGAAVKDTLIPMAYSLTMGGLIPPENPNIVRKFNSEKVSNNLISANASKYLTENGDDLKELLSINTLRTPEQLSAIISANPVTATRIKDIINNINIEVIKAQKEIAKSSTSTAQQKTSSSNFLTNLKNIFSADQ
jgi:hypothetical protein